MRETGRCLKEAEIGVVKCLTTIFIKHLREKPKKSEISFKLP